MALDFRDLIIEAIKNPTDRDKQRLIGPSSMGGCAHCLALEMLGVQSILPRSPPLCQR